MGHIAIDFALGAILALVFVIVVLMCRSKRPDPKMEFFEALIRIAKEVEVGMAKKEDAERRKQSAANR